MKSPWLLVLPCRAEGDTRFMCSRQGSYAHTHIAQTVPPLLTHFPLLHLWGICFCPHCSDPSCASGQRSPLPICSALNKGLCVSASGVSCSCRCLIPDSKSYPWTFSSISLPTWGSSCLPKTFTSTSNSRTPKLCLRSPEAIPEFHLSF